jgi:hypothetical protein
VGGTGVDEVESFDDADQRPGGVDDERGVNVGVLEQVVKVSETGVG